MPKPEKDKKERTPWEEALSNLEASRQALGKSPTDRPQAAAEWAKYLEAYNAAQPSPTSAASAWAAQAQTPRSYRLPMLFQGQPLPSSGVGSGTSLPELMASMGGGAYGASPTDMAGSDDMMMVLDPTGYQIKTILGDEFYNMYLMGKAGLKPGSGESNGPFGFSQTDWDMLNPAQKASYLNKLSGMEAGDPATIFGLSDQEWAMLSPEQRASLMNYVSRYDSTGSASGDPYAGERMRLAWAQLAQERSLAEAQLAARRREMAANIGQSVAQLRQQGWATGLPWSLPKGSTFAPGLGPGGPLAQLYGMSGSTYNPAEYFLGKNNPPSSDQIMNWVAESMGRFG